MKNWLERQSIRTKLVCIGAIAAAAALIPTALFLQRAWVAHAQLAAEAAAVPIAGQVLQLTRLTAQHRGLSNSALAGDSAAQSQRAEVWQKLQGLQAASTAALPLLPSDGLRQGLQAYWRDMGQLAGSVQSASLPPTESFKQHTALVERLLGWVYQLSDEAGLVLHPLPDGYFLQDAALNHLPLSADLLGRLRGAGMGMLTKGQLSPADRQRLTVLLERTVSAYELATRALQHVNPADLRATKVDERAREATEQLTQVRELVEKGVLGVETPTLTPADWWGRLTTAVDAQYAIGGAATSALQQDIDEQLSRSRHTMGWSLGAIVLLALGGAALLWTVAGQTARSMQQALRLAKDVAEGNLAQQAEAERQRSRDEGVRVTQALHDMALSLGSVVRTVRGNADQVATASSEIAMGNADLSARTETQASALQQTSASMDLLRQAIGQGSENAKLASELAASAREQAQQGGGAVAELAGTMQQIQASSQRIAEIIGTIDSIAFQTNILALNAAVEAARAGEEGRGFAVVASEVRALAQRSGAAAQEIRTLIGASVERIELGSRQSENSAATIRQLVDSVARVDQLIQEVSALSSQQSLSVSEIGAAIHQMDDVTQQNAALVEQSAAAAESLRRQAEALQQAVAIFRTSAA
ncbi:MAG: methyl-accepting chemotaxis protein [Roseateles depolymerans]|uniref:Methyl-accepting chemotaxis protein n=1 Tax=Roseateles depolymerans TaxID=76731 RepID=A0A2W5DBA3_9BURK|nr:MAG: methyl-accepting chemotaxis protein [Roseateles depolymerans]